MSRATPTPRCFNLPPSPGPPPRCETTRFLCTVCQETCGFCQKHSEQRCEDTVPERECNIFLTAFMANSSVVSTPATGYCDAVLPAGRRPGTWRHGADGDDHSTGGLRYAAEQHIKGATEMPDEYSSILGQALSAEFDLHNLKPMDAPMVAWKWRTFFNQTNLALGGPSLEVCECENRAGQMENRLFEMQHGSSSVRLAFLGMQGNGAISTVADWSGGWDSLRSSWRSACAAGACKGHRHRVSNAAFLSQHLTPLRPSMVIFGPGPWMQSKGEAGMQNVRSFLAGVKSVLGPRKRAVFRTCPRGSVRLPARRGCSNGASCDEPFRAILNETGWELLDLYTMTDDLWGFIDQEECAKNDKASNRTAKRHHPLPPCRAAGEAFTDNVHFQCSVYREMNRWMVGQLFSRE